MEIGALLSVRNGLERNVPGQLINGTALKTPVPLRSSYRRSESTEQADNPTVKELDLMHKSFKPGMTQGERYKLQDSSSFYRTQFPNTGFSTRLQSFSTRIASINQKDGGGETSAATFREMKKKSLQATCKDMKAEVTKAASMVDYNIKAKHMDTMKSFLASKDFELVTRMTTPPPEKDSNAKKGQDKKGAAQHDATIDDEQSDKKFVCKENIEKDGEELNK